MTVSVQCLCKSIQCVVEHCAAVTIEYQMTAVCEKCHLLICLLNQSTTSLTAHAVRCIASAASRSWRWQLQLMYEACSVLQWQSMQPLALRSYEFADDAAHALAAPAQGVCLQLLLEPIVKQQHQLLRKLAQ
jgi:hypothetical protein